MQEDLPAVVDARSQDDRTALAFLDKLFREKPSIANALHVVDRMRTLDSIKPRSTVRLAILRSFTLEPIVPLLKAAAILNGLELDIWVGGFNAYAQEMLDPGSDLYKFEPHVALIAVQARDVAPELWSGSVGADLDGAASVQRVANSYRDLIGTFRSRSSAHLILQNLEV